MKKKHIIQLILISIVLLSTPKILSEVFPVFSSTSDAGSTITIFSETNKDDLYKKILAYRDQHKTEPIDAKIDRVWKAIPGYNGLEVDIEASYKNMKANGEMDKNKIIFKETSPKIHLDDLEPSPIYRGNPEKPMVALLINVAWGNEYIPGILKILDDSKVKATFFFDGSWVKKNPDLATSISLRGHEIGNHAYSHPDLKQRSRNETTEELKKTNDVIEATLKTKPKWFAPPSGSFNQETILVANELGMKTILWTVDTVDWKKPATSEMVRRVITGVENGSMVLMHPTKPVAEGLESMISSIKEKGYQLGTVSDLMNEKRIDK
ncbi:polysaccharide deacetylase family protein [Sporosarcina sp. ANT_H38]|uniref:polysaccharide deacetylase family protein n=1 Tax=Sporosarcina sp. ANT_H38 TaxID=2597358 RepID=UPI0011F1F41C|nr:polysaccharide deacetylase family protein [Sporosarcina sp. ANT_H38]KAA0965181.1 polysaccharide deacetylase family protein [Sporosarcina sp. ANT_H38]